MSVNRFVEWPHNGRTRFCHSLISGAPLRPAHDQR